MTSGSAFKVSYLTVTSVCALVSSREIFEMTDGCNEINEDASTSEDDSLSLLCNLDACQSKEAPDLELGDFDSQVGNEEQQKEVKINEVKPPESETSSCTQPEAGCPNSSSQLGNYNMNCKLCYYD